MASISADIAALKLKLAAIKAYISEHYKQLLASEM